MCVQNNGSGAQVFYSSASLSELAPGAKPVTIIVPRISGSCDTSLVRGDVGDGSTEFGLIEGELHAWEGRTAYRNAPHFGIGFAMISDPTTGHMSMVAADADSSFAFTSWGSSRDIKTGGTLPQLMAFLDERRRITLGVRNYTVQQNISEPQMLLAGLSSPPPRYRRQAVAPRVGGAACVPQWARQPQSLPPRVPVAAPAPVRDASFQALYSLAWDSADEERQRRQVEAAAAERRAAQGKVAAAEQEREQRRTAERERRAEGEEQRREERRAEERRAEERRQAKIIQAEEAAREAKAAAREAKVAAWKAADDARLADEADPREPEP